jgi:class 3 adenylate cyclase
MATKNGAALYDDTNSPAGEIAHVFFMDLVGYSRLSIEEQRQAANGLRAAVRACAEFGKAERAGNLLRLDTGDGMALVFFRDLIAPLRCAIELTGAISSRTDLPLRIGLHSGPVSRVQDINGGENVAGPGINMAQRVMDCGDAGHILLSSAYADLVSEFGEWRPHLADLGEAQVKHGVRLHLYSYYNAEAGNPAVPAALRIIRPRIALLYRRKVEPDSHVLALLERELPDHGYDVFVDRHLNVGVEWASEIERQVTAAEAVIPLLSASAVDSEMLEYELQTAHKAAQGPRGRPRILPVRVDYEGPLTPALAAILDPLQYALWRDPADDAHLMQQVVEALKQPAVAAATPTAPPLGGAVPLDSAYYVERPTDIAFRAAIERGDGTILLKGARQMGKTSLLARGLQQARDAGTQVALIDFQALSEASLRAPQTLFQALGDGLADQLDLDVYPEDVWSDRRDANSNFERYLRREVLAKIDRPLVWACDEVDRLFACSFGSEVFGLFRSWHNLRALDPAGPWSRLTLVLSYATEAHLFITDLNQSPFNVGTRLALDDFTLAQTEDLNRRHGGPVRSGELPRFHTFLGGQPYLTQRALAALAAHELTAPQLETLGTRDDGLFNDHLRRLLITLSRDAGMQEAVRAVLRGEPCPDSERFYRLRSAGVVVGESAREVRLRCKLYQVYLSRHLA